jgi:uncharacterized repeat protein (TIGR03803 family)
MKNKGFCLGLRAVLSMVLIAPFATNAHAACGDAILHRFSQKPNEGIWPLSTLIFDSAGDLYGTTYQGGSPADAGTVFELIAPKGQSGCWPEKVLFKFHGRDGGQPVAGLVFDNAGNLFGTAQAGGTYSHGVVFELLTKPGGRWVQKVLHDFLDNGKDAVEPRAGVILDGAGNLYGTTFYGGVHQHGAVFEVMPQASGRWREKVLHSFTDDGIDGIAPAGSLVLDASGNLYGTTTGGGIHGGGTVFELTPKTGGGWMEQVLYNFDNGSYPSGGLIFDAVGNLYGTTFASVFELTPHTGASWTETALHNFRTSEGGNLLGNLIFDGAGNLYGTTAFYGPANNGTVFKLSPQGTLTTLRAFDFANGNAPEAGLVFDGAGNLYGTTRYGGTSCSNLGCGLVFKISH